MLYALSKLDSDNLKVIQDLEKEIGSALIAVSGVNVQSAALADDKVRRLQSLEEKLGVVLVAVKPN